MKRKLHPFLLLSMMLLLLAPVLFTACSDDDEKPTTLPEVTTAAVTTVTTTSATGGGEIVSNGNATITARGLVYSSANATPTITDSKTEVTATTGSFTSELTNLTSGTQYHVRAYATNSVGTAYGNVVTFTTGNAAPTATNVAITGTVQVPETLTVSYTYSDAENDTESGTTVQWYIATDGTGTGEAAIAGATELTYTLKPADEFKFIRVGVTPKAATGTTAGTEVKSAFTVAVAEEPSTITFTYNGQTVTYGIIPSPVTGRRWLDRNLGAPNAPTAENDYANYGDLFQWGRGADGHQLINRGATAAESSGVNGTTTTLSGSNTPANALFITNTTTPYDWRSPQNNNLWQGVEGANNPCPTGWYIPTREEWEAEEIAEMMMQDAFTNLGITRGGKRSFVDGAVLNNSSGDYWTSTISGTLAYYVTFHIVVEARFVDEFRSDGKLCKCIKAVNDN